MFPERFGIICSHLQGLHETELYTLYQTILYISDERNEI